MNYIHVHATHTRMRGSPASSARPAGWRTVAVKWNLRLAAANRGIWKASELQRMLAEAGLVISRREDVGAVVGQPGQHQARRPGRHLRRGGLRGGRAADRRSPVSTPGRPVTSPASRPPRPRRPGRRSRPGAVTAARSRPPDARTPGLRPPGHQLPGLPVLRIDPTEPSPTAGPATTSPAATTRQNAPAARGSSRSRRATAGCAGCRPAFAATGARSPSRLRARQAATSSCHSRE